MKQIRECFSNVASDRFGSVTTSKRWGMLFLINHLMCLSFQLNNFTQVKSLLRTIEQAPEFQHHANMSDRVTYAYYNGRRSLFDDALDDADHQLTFAFKHCLPSSPRNKRLILIYLVPVKLLRGQMPSEAMLTQYNLPQYIDIARAVRNGNILLLTEALAKEQLFFIQWGVFLILERLRMITYRNLFKKVFACHGR